MHLLCLPQHLPNLAAGVHGWRSYQSAANPWHEISQGKPEYRRANGYHGHSGGDARASVELERAYLQGVNIEKVALAFIDTQKDGKKVLFQDTVDAELHQLLEEKLKG